VVIDVIAAEPHFVDHLAPVWAALPEEERGTFWYRGSGPVRCVPGMVRGQPPRSSAPTLVASAGDLHFAAVHSRRVAIMEHGCGQSFGGDKRASVHASYAGGNHRDGASLFLHPGPHPAGRDRGRYPAARVEIVGCPKLDSLPRKARKGPPVLAVAFHWNGPVCPETKSGFAEFARLLAGLAKSYQVLGHGHPRILDRIAPLYARCGIEVVRTFDEVCARADLYLNDASSTLYEFAATGRPVVVLNSDAYRRSVTHGLRFWDAATVGVQTTHRRSLTDAVAEALEDCPSQQVAREAAVDLVYAYRTGAAQRTADVLLDWAA
jgi:hypothetical protein